jgi:predicted kinase
MPLAPASHVILLVGLPGVGKTTLANALAERLGGLILSRDLIRDSIFPSIYLDYSREQNQVGTDTLLAVLNYLLRRHHPPCLIIDGKPFSRSHEIRSILTLASNCDAVVHIVHCHAPLDVIRERLIEGLSDATNFRAQRTPQKAERIHGEFEPLDVAHVKVDMTQQLETVVDAVVAYVGRHAEAS